jgi:hypothetical protein
MGWFKAELSLERRASLAIEQQKMKQLPMQELQERAAGWMQTLCIQHEIVNSLARRVQELEIDIALGQAKPLDHLAMARQLTQAAEATEPQGDERTARAPRWRLPVAALAVAAAGGLAVQSLAPLGVPASRPGAPWQWLPAACRGGPIER